MEIEPVEIGILPEPLMSAKKEKKFVRVWATPEGKVFGRYFESTKVPVEQKIATLDKRIARFKSETKEVENELKKLKEIDASLLPAVNRKIMGRNNKLSALREKIAAAEKKKSQLVA